MELEISSTEQENSNISTDNFAVWRECLNIIGSRVNTQSFKTWFEPIKSTKLEAGILTLEVPSHFFYEWVEEHYSNILADAVTAVLGLSGKINFTINSEFGDEKEPDEIPAMSDISNAMPKKTETYSDLTQYRYTDTVRHKETNSFKPINTALNPKNTFDNFIKGESNQLARAAAFAVANNPGGTQFNPLVVYGDVGLGKTHLIQAIGIHALSQGKAKRVGYVTSELFTLEFVDAIQNDSMSNFSNYYRSMDILIVDDIQFFTGREKTQDHFFHTFNTLHQSGKQIILSSDRPVKELKGLNERLISRFQSGLTADIQTPDLETRTAILRKKSLDNGIELRQDVLEFLALNVKSNIRELEGCLISLLAHSSIQNNEIDLNLAKVVVRSIVGEIKTHITIEDIQRTVCNYFNIPEDLVRAKTRKQEVVFARQLAMYLSKELTNFSLKTIGLHFGGRDHSTVIHAYQTIEDLIKNDKKYVDLVQQLKSKINHHS